MLSRPICLSSGNGILRKRVDLKSRELKGVFTLVLFFLFSFFMFLFIHVVVLLCFLLLTQDSFVAVVHVFIEPRTVIALRFIYERFSWGFEGARF